MKLLKFEGCY